MHTTDVLKELQLQLQQLIDADVRRVVGNLLWRIDALLGLIYDDTIEARPLVCNIVNAHAASFQCLFRNHQHTFCTGSHYPVVHRDKTVGITLLVQHVSHKAVYLSVNEGICLENIRMALVLVRCLSLVKNISEWCQVVIVPVVIDEPLCLDKRNVLQFHACCKATLQARLVNVLYQLLVVFCVNLEDLAIVIVMTAVTSLLLLAPDFDDSAQTGVADKQEVVVMDTAESELLIGALDRPAVCCLMIDASQLLIVFGGLGKLLCQLSERYLMYFANHRTVPSSEVAHVAVDEEVVWLHIVRPTVHLIIMAVPSEPLTMYHEATDKELFKAASMYLTHPVHLHDTLQDGAHRLANLLFVAVSRSTDGFLAL